MRIAVTNDMHANGGAVAMMAHRFTRALQAAGHDATLITGVAEDPPPDDVPLAGWAYPERQGESFFDLIRFYRKLRARSGDAFARWFESGPRPDLWIALVIPSALGALDAGGRRVPLLYICNSPWAMEWVSACRAAGGGEPVGWRRALGVLPRRRAERQVVVRGAAWTSLHQIQLDWFGAEHPGCSRIPKHVIPAAVDATLFTPLDPETRASVRRRCFADDGKKLLVCSRRMVPRTGVDMLLRALAESGDDSRLVLTGDGPERPRLEALARQLEIAARVTFTGFVAPEELRALTAAADFAVLPTRELEGFGLSAAEALASGTPVISTPVGALTDVVGAFDRRLLARDVSDEGLAEVLVRALNTPELGASEFRRRAREYAIERFDWNRHKDDFIRLAESCGARR